MTLTQLNAFVLVARLGSVTAAANALGVSEPAVSQALSALRMHLGDQLVSRGPAGMTLTPGGSRLLATASQIVVLGAEAHAAVRAAQGAPEQLRVVASSTVAEFVTAPLVEAFTKRFATGLEVSSGVAVAKEMAVLVANRLADVAIGPDVTAEAGLPVISEPIFKYRLVAVAAGHSRPRGGLHQWRWLVGPSGTDSDSDVGSVLARLRIPDERIGVFPSETAAWAAAADGGGVSLAGLLVRDPARPAAAQRGGQLAAALPLDARGHAPDALAGRRGAAVPVPAAGLRHYLELTGYSQLGGSWRAAGGDFKQELISALRGS